MFVTRKTYAAAIARADAAERRAEDREHRLRMIVSHATGGHSADWERSVNDVCVDISRNRNHVFRAGRVGALTEAERKVLECMSDELIFPAAQMAADTGVPEKDVRLIYRSFALRGLAHFGHALSDGGEGTSLCGRGYTLTGKGVDLQDQSRQA